jgi:hypothetical protein
MSKTKITGKIEITGKVYISLYEARNEILTIIWNSHLE